MASCRREQEDCRRTVNQLFQVSSEKLFLTSLLRALPIEGKTILEGEILAYLSAIAKILSSKISCLAKWHC